MEKTPFYLIFPTFTHVSSHCIGFALILRPPFPNPLPQPPPHRLVTHQHPPPRARALPLSPCSVGRHCQLRNMLTALTPIGTLKGPFELHFSWSSPPSPNSIKTEKIVILKIWPLAHFILLSSLSVG